MAAFTIPDFVVVGGYYELDDGPEVILIASKNLKEIELREVLRDLSYLDRYRRMLPPEYDMFLTAQVREYVVIRAKSYPEAWESLFKFWSPPEAQKKELENRKAIGHQ